MANTSSSTEYHRRKLNTRVVSDIERRVLSRQLQVGQRLPSEAELARVYDVSTRSVRDCTGASGGLTRSSTTSDGSAVLQTFWKR